MRATQAIIDTSALLHNLEIIKKLAPNSKITAIVKANAYGHGLCAVANALSAKTDSFGVASSDEACTLREAGIKNKILLLEGFFKADELHLIQQHKLDVVIHSQYQIDAIADFKGELSLNCWLKADTGMHRLGFNANDFLNAFQQLKQMTQKVSSLGLMSHFANAEQLHAADTHQQLKCFKKITGSIAGPIDKTLANSAAILALPETHHQLVRPGIMLYGCSPFTATTGKQHGLKAVMTLESELISISDLNKGETVGYGSTWKAKQDTKIGIIAIGYGDGYPRHAPSGTPVWLNGREVSLTGTVSMDMLAVELGVNASDKVGDRAVLWGSELAVERIAEAAETISYELLCGITRRVNFKLL